MHTHTHTHARTRTHTHTHNTTTHHFPSFSGPQTSADQNSVPPDPVPQLTPFFLRCMSICDPELAWSFLVSLSHNPPLLAHRCPRTPRVTWAKNGGPVSSPLHNSCQSLPGQSWPSRSLRLHCLITWGQIPSSRAHSTLPPQSLGSGTSLPNLPPPHPSPAAHPLPLMCHCLDDTTQGTTLRRDLAVTDGICERV